MITVTKHYGFEACHHLPHYDGACANLHGHSYKLDVTIGGRIITDKDNPKQGMILDFKDLKNIINEIFPHILYCRDIQRKNDMTVILPLPFNKGLNALFNDP